MVMDAEEQASLNAPCYAARYLATTLSGDGQWAAPLPFTARVEPSNQYLRTTPQGEQVTSNWTLYTLQLINMSDRVWLPGADPTNLKVAHQVKQVDVLYDDDGSLHHYEVSL